MGEVTKIKVRAAKGIARAKADEEKAKVDALSWYAKFKGCLNDTVFVQLGHGAGGYGMTLTPLVFGVTWLHLLYGVIIVLAWSTPKEYLFDIYVEKQTYADGWIDQRSYLIGCAIAVCVALGALL